MEFSKSLSDNVERLKRVLQTDKNFDIVYRTFEIAGRKAALFFVDGFTKDEVLLKMMQSWWAIKEADMPEDAHGFSKKYLPYGEIGLVKEEEDMLVQLLAGISCLFIDGFELCMTIDCRTYPARSVGEPEKDKVMRGSRDGFVETLLLNANLIRRRVRSPRLCFSMHSVGTESRTDVAIAYLENTVNKELLDKISRIIDSLQVTSLTMGAKSLDELILPKRWWNPLPSIQITERPDVACSYLEEGHILLLVDNSPVVLILPCTIFQFTQSPEDYYNSPSVGTYFRLIRFLCIPVSLLLMPLFLLLTAFFPDFSQRWGLLSTENLAPERIFFYVLAVEFILDLFKYSSSLSSGKFSGSLSVVGGLIIGDIAVSLNWVSVEVLFYGAITLLASLSISGKEFSDALRLYRILLVFLTGFFGLPGFLSGLALVLLSAVTTPTFGGFSYFWPLFPFNRKALGRLLFRSPTPKAQPTRIWSRGKLKDD